MKRLALLSLGLLSVLPLCAGGGHEIRKADEVRVTVAQGTVPVLPWQVRVTFKDGTQEWRQVKWENSGRDEEKALSLKSDDYTVSGVVLGDDSFGISAYVHVAGSLESDALYVVAQPLPLSDVRLKGENRLTWNRDLDVAALLKLDITKYLYNYRDAFGLSLEGYSRPDGWDSPTTKLKGHGSGHYMSALALAYAGVSDLEIRSQLLSRMRRMVDQMYECQQMTHVYSDSLGRYFEARDLAPESELMGLGGTWRDFAGYAKHPERYGYGYVNAIPAQHPVLVEAYRPYNNDQWVWAPYYTIHKQLAGLIDIARYVDDKALADKALGVATEMGLWVWNRLHYRTFVKSDGDRRERPGNRYEMWNMYIAGEVGGMEESLSRLAGMSTDSDVRERLLEAAHCFDAPAFFKPVIQGIDDIRGRHANQHIPMITGALQAYSVEGGGDGYTLARNFWNMVQGRYVYATGGVGNGEMFREPYTQMASMNMNSTTDFRRNKVPDPHLNETCCAYNLAKLTRDLNCFTPDDASLMDYYERVLYNQIVGSVNSSDYSTTYQYAVGLSAAKPFGNRTPQESCCGGTGAENHVKYQEAAYFVSDNTIWVALYMPAEAVWRAKGVTLQQDCEWPAERSVIAVTDGSARFSMKLRIPYWANQGVSIRLNGRKVARKYAPCSYVEIPERLWKPGDKVEIVMPFGVHLNWGPDKMEQAVVAGMAEPRQFEPAWMAAVMYGPLVMATDGVRDWSEADVSLSSDMHEFETVPSDDGVFTLRLGELQFKPDYWQTGASTHYLRVGWAPHE